MSGLKLPPELLLKTEITGLNSMGICNGPWGICGFTSSLYALHNNSPTEKHARLEMGGHSPTRMLAEIKTYLRILQAEGRQDILDSIEEFTQSFGTFETWTITNYIERINSVVRMQGGDVYVKDDKYGIGMPPAAVVDYMKRVCGFTNARQIGLGDTKAEMILGMGTHLLGMPLYDGLGHYLYSLNGRIHSWGNDYGDTATAMQVLAGVTGVPGASWKIVAKIALD